MSLWRWRELFSSLEASQVISLGEGLTPLVGSRRLGPSLGLNNLYFKLETGNPSGSYKDRFASAAISDMVAKGQTTCIATSSGNTGAALAAYCAAAGIECRIAIVEGAPAGKLRQMQAYGAKIARVRKFGVDPQVTTEVLRHLDRMGHQPGHALQISAFVYSPAGMAGVQTLSYELAEQLPDGIDHVFCPAGGGGLCVAAARGFEQLPQRSAVRRIPAVECVQPEGNNTIAGPLMTGAERAQATACTTQISGLQVASVIDGDLALSACRSTGGSGHLVRDEDVWALQARLAREEGIFSEPAGVVALAGAAKAVAEGRIHPDATVVCLVTGFGFKDDQSVDRMIADSSCPLIDATDLSDW